jgi:hypothetical protein
VNPRITLVVVALFVLLFGYVYFVELNKTPEQLGTPTPVAQPQVFQLNAKDVKSIEVRDLRAPRETKLTRTETGWTIDLPVQKAADSPTVDSTIGQLTTLQATRVLTNVTDLAPFGFVTATLEARLIMSDTTPYALTVGGQTPNGSDYYAVYTGDKSKVFIVSSATVTTLMGWLNTPPVEPTPMPTSTATPPVTPTAATTPELTPAPALTPTP